MFRLRKIPIFVGNGNLQPKTRATDTGGNTSFWRTGLPSPCITTDLLRKEKCLCTFVITRDAATHIISKKERKQRTCTMRLLKDDLKDQSSTLSPLTYSIKQRLTKLTLPKPPMILVALEDTFCISALSIETNTEYPTEDPSINPLQNLKKILSEKISQLLKERK